MEIARGVGTPLQLDRVTKEREFGYFARILVDVDIASDLPNTLMVERESHCFPVEVMYENLCSNCGVVGHNSDCCRQLQSKVEPHKKQAPQAIRQEYRAKPKPIEEVIISKQTTATENETDKSLELRDAINGSPGDHRNIASDYGNLSVASCDKRTTYREGDRYCAKYHWEL